MRKLERRAQMLLPNFPSSVWVSACGQWELCMPRAPKKSVSLQVQKTDYVPKLSLQAWEEKPGYLN